MSRRRGKCLRCSFVEIFVNIFVFRGLDLSSCQNLDSVPHLADSCLGMAEQTSLERQGLMDEECEEKYQSSGGATPTDKEPHPFKRWMDSFRPWKHEVTYQRRYVEGWSDSSSQGSQDQHSSTSDSSQLGTVITASTSFTSQSILRSRSTIPGGTTPSMFSDSGNSTDSPRPSSSTRPDEATDSRATRRRHILQEIITTECDYVLGLKALNGVSH